MERNTRKVRIRLPGGVKFSLTEYKKEQQLIAEQMALGAPAALELVKRASKSKTVEPHKARLTWQSYVLQEAEAAARYHKIEWCEIHGKEVLSLQHDGIIVDRRGKETWKGGGGGDEQIRGDSSGIPGVGEA
jgi:hypothetical protein|eukprot:2440537-Prymnesium_polylepis.1